MGSIKWSPTSAPLRDESPGTIVCGSPGSGKTFAMQNIAINSLGMGQRVIVIDPKDDFAKIQRIVPNVKVIDVKNIIPGALNPFTFLRTKYSDGSIQQVSSAIIENIVSILSGPSLMKEENERFVSPIIQDFVGESSRKLVTLYQLTDYLAFTDNDICRSIAVQLQKYTEHSFELGNLLFEQNVNIKPLEISDSDNIVFTFNGMSLPPYDKKPSEYDGMERFVSALVYIICTKLKNMLFAHKHTIPVLFICDEAHMLFSNKEMKSLIDDFLRLGRSYHIATMLASQGITHFPSDIANYMSSKFIFKSSRDEAQEFINRFDDTKGSANPLNVSATVNAISNLPKGYCFMIDARNRNGFIHITSQYDLKLFAGEYKPNEVVKV